LRCLVKLDFFGDNACNGYRMFDAVGRVTTMGVRKGGFLSIPPSLDIKSLHKVYSLCK